MSGGPDAGAPMGPERFREVKEALLRARALASPERAAFLDELEARDPALRREVASLLAAEERPAAIVETGVVDAMAGLPASAVGGRMPERIGPYRLREVLGEGGMGVVYRAEQERPIRREVALKVIRGRFAPDWVVSRFDAERQALALMNHPNIARVYDAGADETGHPWFAMELVPGVPLTDYCDGERLETRARLALFLQLCDAIEHAHQKGVIHRDLKPSNVLVGGHGGERVLKVIDFGIAKALDPGVPVVGDMTRTGHVVGTPSYMSPEQAGAIPAPVDTRSDVYALGVMLYELLCGTRPFEPSGEEVSPLEIRRTLGEREPQRPSARLATTERSGEAGERIARTRGTSTARLRRQLSGDLDNIVLMALRREPDRRYASVERFAADVRRHLDGLPVAARPDTWRYRTGKFVRRHSAGVTVAAAAAVLLVVFVVALIVQSGRLADERNRAVLAEREARINAARAREEADAAKATAKFLAGLFDGADPDAAGGREVTARELLDRGARQLNAELRGRPALRGRLLVALGEVYVKLADYPRAQALAESAYAALHEVAAPRDEDLAAALDLLSGVAHDRRDMPASAKYAREVVALRRRTSPHSVELATSLADLAIPLRAMGQYAEAESLLREALDIHRTTVPVDSGEVAWDLNMLGYVLYSRGDLAEAERRFRGALAIQRRTLTAPHSELAATVNNLGGILLARGRPKQAESQFRDALDQYRALYGERHPATGRGYGNLARALADQGRTAEALALFRHSLAAVLAGVEPMSDFVAGALQSLGNARRDLGDFAGADSCLRAALALRRGNLADRSGREFASVQLSLAELALDRGHGAEAVTLARRAFGPQTEGLQSDDLRVADAKRVLGQALVADGEPAAAEPLLRDVRDVVERVLEPGDWRIDRARVALGACTLGLGRTAEARPLLEQGAKGLRAALAPDDVRRRRAEALLADPRLAAR